MGTFCLLWCAALGLLCLQGATGQASCPGLVAAISSQPDCSVPVPTMCYAVQCTVGSQTTTVTVAQCTDPLEISLEIESGSTFAHTFNASSVVTANGVTVDFATSRTASSVTLQASFLDGAVLIPTLTIGLNQTECMCESMEALAGNVNSPVTTNCQRTSSCNGVSCVLSSVFTGTVDLDVIFDVCQEPPRVEVVITDSSNEILLNEFIDSTETFVIPISPLIELTLDVIIENHEYSMILQVTMLVLGGTYQFFPKQQIIFDKSGCSVESSSAPVTIPTSQPTSGETSSIIVILTTSPISVVLEASSVSTGTSAPVSISTEESDNLSTPASQIYVFSTTSASVLPSAEQTASSVSIGTSAHVSLSTEESDSLSTPASQIHVFSTTSVSVLPSAEQTGLTSVTIAAIVVPILLLVLVLAALAAFTAAAFVVLKHRSNPNQDVATELDTKEALSL